MGPCCGYVSGQGAPRSFISNSSTWAFTTWTYIMPNFPQPELMKSIFWKAQCKTFHLFLLSLTSLLSAHDSSRKAFWVLILESHMSAPALFTYEKQPLGLTSKCDKLLNGQGQGSSPAVHHLHPLSDGKFPLGTNAQWATDQWTPGKAGASTGWEK